MENSLNAVNRKATNSVDDSFEESGWTMYFEDFIVNNNNDQYGGDHYEPSLDAEASSLVSDGSSLAAKKSVAWQQPVARLSFDDRNRLSFKKRRTKEALLDDSLEDTASSPVNSPKVSNMMNQSQFNRATKQKEYHVESSEEKGNEAGKLEEKRIEEFRCNVMNGRESDEYSTELKKRGLCLVPMSTVVNFLG